MINRAAVILKYKKSAIDWINEADPAGDDPGISIESANKDATAYLIRTEDAESSEHIDKWIKLNYEELFESELDSWYTDEALWPKNRNLKLFKEWFDIEYSTLLHDTVSEQIEDDEADPGATVH